MGAQQVKERTAGSALGAGTSLRASRIKSRVPKDSRLIGSNIFTEHSGKRPMRTYGFLFIYFNLILTIL